MDVDRDARITDPDPEDEPAAADAALDLDPADADAALDVEPADADQDAATAAELDDIEPIPLPAAPEAVAAEGPLLADADTFRDRWNDVQASFVDDPRSAVEGAGHLVADVLDELARSLTARRDDLEAQWARSDDTSTEELRLAFRAYRSFFDRVVSS